MPTHVYKFGGAPLGSARAVARAAETVLGAATTTRLTVVVSAFEGVTDRLLFASRAAAAGDLGGALNVLDALGHHHADIARAVVSSPPELEILGDEIGGLLDRARALCRDLAIARRRIARAVDLLASFGERLSAPILAAALRSRGLEAVAIDAASVIVTGGTPAAANPSVAAIRQRARQLLRPLLDRNAVVVVPGFYGATPSGTATLLGRGGSDYTASLLAAALEADEIVFFKDVDGVMTADPRLVPSARPLATCSYTELAELAQNGAKLVHPRAVGPLAGASIPVRFRNAFAPSVPGTVVGRAVEQQSRVRALAVREDAGLVPAGLAYRPTHRVVSMPVSAIALVGDRIREHRGLLGDSIAALREAGVSTLAIDPDRSARSVRFFVMSRDVAAAAAALHTLVHERASHTAPHGQGELSATYA